MNLNMFDNIEGVVLRERENSFPKQYNGETNSLPNTMSLAMAYVPYQKWGDTMTPEDALNSGTLFSDLVFPFEGCTQAARLCAVEKGGRR